MNLSEVHSLSPAFPDVGGGLLGGGTPGGGTNLGAQPNQQKKKGKFCFCNLIEAM